MPFIPPKVATRVTFQTGDAVHILKTLSLKEKYRGLFKAIITSPPYYKCRHYGQNINEIGRENNVQKVLGEFGICILSVQECFI